MIKQKLGNTKRGVMSVTSRGIGFVNVPGHDQDIMIEHDHLNTALHGDTVGIVLHPIVQENRLRGEVVEVVHRARTQFVGVVEHDRGLCFVNPDNRRMYTDIAIPEHDAANLSTGTKVLVEITHWDNPHKNPEGKVLSVLGKKGEHEVEMQSIVIEHGFTTTFGAEVLAEAQNLTKEISAEEISRRRDMRGVTTFTIDPKTAQDFDDALSIATKENGDLEIGIHIADVTHYVRPNTALEKEARKRATSVYLVDRTIPMLPLRLSNDICSLNPNEDRLAFSAIFTIDPKSHNVKGRWYGETVIHSNKRFTYAEAQQVLDTGKGILVDELKHLKEIADTLHKNRAKEGMIEFEQDEVAFELDQNGKPVRVYVKKRHETMKLIEEFMLLANREVATHVYTICKDSGGDHAFVYRIHDTPDPDKIEELKIFLRAIGHDLSSKDGAVTARDINTLFAEIKGTPEENLIKTATIRSMAKAIYSTKNIGHFGLSFQYYTHFTSPIRRYPDMMVHRILKNYIKGEHIDTQAYATYENLSVHASQKEVEAVQAERDSIKFKQVEYMLNHIGETFDGLITGVTDWGMYVEEKNTKAEGLVKISTLGDEYFIHDKKQYALIGQSSKHSYALGGEVRVKLTGADIEAKTLDFVLV